MYKKFEIVRRANEEYVQAVNEGARKEVQENLLKQCDVLFRVTVLEPGLTKEYAEWWEETKNV